MLIRHSLLVPGPLFLLFSLVVACGSESDPAAPSGGAAGSTAGSAGSSASGAPSAGSASGGMSGGSTTGGSAGSGGSGGTTGGSSAGGGAGGQAGSMAGNAGASAGGSSGASGSGGSAGGGAGGSAGAASGKSAVAMIMPTGVNQEVTGTATFSETAGSVMLTLQLTNCPVGGHATHLHETKNCGDNGNAAGGHWIPQGEGIGNINCMADGTGMLTFTAPAGRWTIGAGAGDVTQHSIMVHERAEAQGMDPGGRIGCGLINVRP